MDPVAMYMLPLELIIQTLLRLPVCNSWLSLISNDTHFALSHFQLQHSLVESCSLDQFYLLTFKDDSSYASSNIYFMYPHDLHGSFDIYLWNPSTGFHKQLPLSRNCSSYRNYFYGFGYEESTDDYFLVSISHDPKLANTKHLEIFSFGKKLRLLTALIPIPLLITPK